MNVYKNRSSDPELMDDLQIAGANLTRSLDELRVVNRWLGGYSALMSVLRPYLRRQNAPVRILDIGAGSGDMAECVVKWAVRQDPPIDVSFVVTDANAATVEYARHSLAQRLGPADAARVTAHVADATCLPYQDGEFDIVTASLFLHHLPDDLIIHVLKSINRISRVGIIVSDLHRHPCAYYGFQAAAVALNASEMLRHDGAVSVLRGFTRSELTNLAHRAGIITNGPRWRWAFRWLLSTVPL